MSDTIREIIFDTETTGLSPQDGDRIIEIGGIELVNRFPTGRVFHRYINPQGRDVHPDAENIHGISNAFLADKPTFPEILDEFLEFFGAGMLVAHNATFDIGFFNAELFRVNQPGIDPERVVDTLTIARRKFPGQRNSLDALCARFSISNAHREKHGALLDSELLADVYLELLGGKQGSLGLERRNTETEDQGNIERNDSRETSLTRPKPLPQRLSESEIELHRQFIETLGDNPIWKKAGLF